MSLNTLPMPGSSPPPLYSSPEPAPQALEESPPSPASNDYILAPHESESTDLVAKTSHFLYKRDQALAYPKVQGLVRVNSQTLVRLIQTLKLQGIRTSMDTKGIASISFSCRQKAKASEPLNDHSAGNNEAAVFYPIGTSTVHDLLFLRGSGTPDISRELTVFQSGPEQTPTSDWLVVSEGAAPGVYSSQTLKSYSVPDFAVKTVKVEEGRLRNALYCYKEKAFRHHLYVRDPLTVGRHFRIGATLGPMGTGHDPSSSDDPFNRPTSLLSRKENMRRNCNGIRGLLGVMVIAFSDRGIQNSKKSAFDSLPLSQRQHPGIAQLQTMARVAAEITPSVMRSLLVMLGSARMTTDFVAPAEDVLETITFYCDEQWDESDLRVDRLVESASSDSALGGPFPLDIHFSYIGSSSDDGQIRMSVQNLRPFMPPPEPLAPSSAVIPRRAWHTKSCVYHGWRSIAALVKATNSAWSHWITEKDAIERFILLCYSSELVVLRNNSGRHLFLGYDINDEEAWKARKEKTVVLME
ncbi:hypothetical protein C8J56DRAFT_1124125 [Mycena floridula]|nr:hypothetical protein C8J56DRAFT_1124125 [Mycena floridula]